jgi:hypothetical protein
LGPKLGGIEWTGGNKLMGKIIKIGENKTIN